MSKTKLTGLVVALLAAVAWTAQSATSRNDRPTAGAVERGGTLVAARAADVVLWDPAHINENDSLWAGFQTNANLIMTTPDGTTNSPAPPPLRVAPCSVPA